MPIMSGTKANARDSSWVMDTALPVPNADEANVVSFELFYVTNGDLIRRTLAVILGDSDLASEATDEAMTRAYERWHRVSRIENPSGWTYRVALNWAKRQMRRRGYGKALPKVVAYDREPSAPDIRLWEALDGLSTDHRAVVILRYAEDWSEKQISSALRIPVGTVKSRLHRALHHLRKELQ